MRLTIQQMHDATLLSIRFDWQERVCSLEFAGAPALPEPFMLTFTNVRELAVSADFPWGPSVSVLEVSEPEAGRYEFMMQSGDAIVIVAPASTFELLPLSGLHTGNPHTN